MKYKNIIISFLILFTLTISSKNTFAQFFEDSQAPLSQKWFKIETPNFKLIFPEEMKDKAPTLANLVHNSLRTTSRNYKITPRKIPFIIHNTNLQANGFVQLSPRKSELYSTAGAEPDNQTWLPNLILHESRHVSQFDKLTGKLGAPFFEQLALAYYGLTVPSWFFEGDATLTETIYSRGGRGRLPSFEMPIKANFQSKQNYSFDKYLLGSFKDIVPSYYTIGYLMTSTLKSELSPNYEADLFSELNKRPLYPYNINRVLKKKTGGNSRHLFNKTITKLDSIWEQKTAYYHSQKYTEINGQNNRYYNSNLLPKSNGNLIYFIKQNPEKTNAIYTYDNDKKSESQLVKTGIQLTPHFDINKEYIVWDELRKDPRYNKRTYSVINLMNRKTGKIKTLTKQSRYYSPIFSPVDESIACIEVDLSNTSYLTLISLKNGSVIKRIKTADSEQLQHPAFNPTGDKVIAIRLSEIGTALCEIDLKSDKITNITSWGDQQYERPQYLTGMDILVKANFNGIDNIYKIDRRSEAKHLLTKAPFGAFNPFYNKETKQLLFNNYQYNGYKISEASIDTAFTIKPETDYFSHYYADAVKKDSMFNIAATAPDSNQHYTITPYKGLGRTFNFHSLSLSSSNFESFDNFKPGIFWLSNNILNTTQIALGYEYDTDIRKGIYSAELTYNKYFPKFSLRYENRGQIAAANIPNKPDSSVRFDWREHYVSSQISIPLSFYRLDYTYSMGFNFATAYLKRYNLSRNDLKNFNYETAFPLTYQLYFNRNARMATMDQYPRWGQNFSITYRHTPFENKAKGEILSARTVFYLPGFMNNHGFQIRLSAQAGTGIYEYINDIPLVSGFSYYKYEKVKNTLLINYRFPIAYPDFGVGSLAYIKRIKGGVFADYQNIHKHKEAAPKSFGAYLSFDFNAFRYPLPDFEFVVKGTYINDNTATQRIVPTVSLNYTY
ncbi:hypothetical protein D7322_10800 [Sphingobacterium puteale]|uniref:DUF4157 domain-containing protein n=1 Tax=Sphingobacterium puteale TaxID=2420510 RepID=A0A420VZV8_9SPHI|nr:hypothetical protein [Sphingobacterium puteale]RKO71872.1 hypothetical protein D7322_10800 [Sphingobacterium puteale]